jgi:hypothetical protein
MLILFFPGSSNPFTNEKNHIANQSIRIDNIGSFFYNTYNVSTVRPDIFVQGAFSIFGILVYLDTQEEIQLIYHFDESMNTHVIDSINGLSNWWYYAHYDGGWRENNVFRMDHYPVKEKMTIQLYQKDQNIIHDYYDTFQNEIARFNSNNGKIIIPEVIIQGTQNTYRFTNIKVTSHNLREDIFKDSIITAIDVIMTLGDLGESTYDLQWYESIGFAEIVKNYWVEAINDDQAFNRCGFVYEVGSITYQGFQGNHIHIPADIRVINSPEYMEWFWICL